MSLELLEYRKITRPFPPTARAARPRRAAQARLKRRMRTSGTVKAKRLVQTSGMVYCGQGKDCGSLFGAPDFAPFVVTVLEAPL